MAVAKAAEQVRCAIYTRVSTPDQAGGNFSSLDNQREMADAYILSQGWGTVGQQYNDAGFSGSTLERPALDRLLRDAQDGLVDCIVVTKIDRLSRSLLDFARIVDVLDRHGVSFVAVTQQFDTSTPMGKLTLNVLLSFAQFEREMIAERTREKMVAARRKGKYTGGTPPLGYDAREGKLVVNDDEAVRVRAIFDLYLKHESLTATLAEMAERRWTTKSWTTRRGYHRKGLPFQKASLLSLITNPVYIGKMEYQGESYEGEHAGTADSEVWDRTQRILKSNCSNGGRGVRNRYGALLKGILRCAPCDSAMTHSFTKKNGRRYRYYVCCKAQKTGWANCPTRSVAAGEIEQAIYDRIRMIGRDPVLVQETIAAARKQLTDEIEQLEADVNVAERRLARLRDERQTLLETIGRGGTVAARAAERLDQVAGEISGKTSSVSALRRQVADLSAQEIDEEDLTTVLGKLDPIWDVLLPRERTRIIRLLIKLVDFDGEKIGMTFHPSGIKTLVENG
jgi:site-specific DNA recombinase